MPQPNREGLKEQIDHLSDQEVITVWKVVAAMRQPEELAPEEAREVDQALREIDAGDFTTLDAMKRAL